METLFDYWMQREQWNKWAIGAWGAALLAILLVVAWIAMGRSRPVPPKPTPPIPVVLKEELVKNLLTANEMKVTVRNDGPAGLVNIAVYSLEDVGGQVTRGESGVEKTLRETFTRNLEPEAKYIPNYQRFHYGSANARFQAGETKTIIVPVPGYNWASSLSGVTLHVKVTGE